MAIFGAYGILAIFFAVLEYFSHRSYHEKHPDYEKSGSGVIGFVILAIGLLVSTFTNG